MSFVEPAFSYVQGKYLFRFHRVTIQRDRQLLGQWKYFYPYPAYFSSRLKASSVSSVLVVSGNF